MTGIYCITNIIDNKKYVGQSTNIEYRWKIHLQQAKQPSFYGYNYPLYRALRKFGASNFKFEVLEECQEQFLDDREIYWISQLETFPVSLGKGYNILKGGRGNYRRLSLDQILEVIEILQQKTLSFTEIAAKYKVCKSIISLINRGKRGYKLDGITYPVVAKYPCHRSKVERKLRTKSDQNLQKQGVPTTCPICGKPIRSTSSLCFDCLMKQVTKRPSRQELLIKLHEANYNREVAAQLCGVAGNTLRKWCIKYSIPLQQKNQLKQLYQIEILGATTQIKASPLTLKVAQVDPTTSETVQIFNSREAVARSLGLKGSTPLRYAIQHKTLYRGYYWKLLD